MHVNIFSINSIKIISTSIILILLSACSLKSTNNNFSEQEKLQVITTVQSQVHETLEPKVISIIPKTTKKNVANTIVNKRKKIGLNEILKSIIYRIKTLENSNKKTKESLHNITLGINSNETQTTLNKEKINLIIKTLEENYFTEVPKSFNDSSSLVLDNNTTEEQK